MTGDILDEIDDVLTDWYGSDDSMHWSPDQPELDRVAAALDPPRLWIGVPGADPLDVTSPGWMEVTGYLTPGGLEIQGLEPAWTAVDETDQWALGGGSLTLTMSNENAYYHPESSVWCCPPMQLGCERCCPPREVQPPNPQAYLDIHKRRRSR